MGKMVPVLDTVCVLEVPGKILLEALENGVSKYPSFDGRFLSVSGLSFAFDPNLPAYKRIQKESIRMEKGEFKEENLYKVVVKGYLVLGFLFLIDLRFYYSILGKDGYDVLKNCKKIIDIQNAMTFQTIVNEFFGLLT